MSCIYRVISSEGLQRKEMAPWKWLFCPSQPLWLTEAGNCVCVADSSLVKLRAGVAAGRGGLAERVLQLPNPCAKFGRSAEGFRCSGKQSII